MKTSLQVQHPLAAGLHSSLIQKLLSVCFYDLGSGGSKDGKEVPGAGPPWQGLREDSWQGLDAP